MRHSLILFCQKFTQGNSGFICLLNFAWRQTHTGKPWICLPGLLSGGRHIQESLRFVCRVICLAADIYRKVLDLSAGFIVWRQTYTGKPCICLPGLLSSGRHIQEILRFVCLVYCLAAAKSQEIKNLSARAACGAGIWQSGGRYGADMGRYSAAIAKDCRYDKSLRCRSENLPERCTKIRPYKEKIQA